MILLKIFLILLGLLLGILIPKIWLTLNLRLTDSAKTGSARVQLLGKLIGLLVDIEWPDVVVKVGITRVYFPLWSRKSLQKKPPQKEAKAFKPKKPAASKSSRHSVPEWIEFGKTLIARFFKIPRIERFQADLVLGLGNPAYTGFAIGAYYALKPTLKALRSVKIEPDFIKKKINGEIEFCGSIRLIKTIPLIILTLRFLWKK